MRAIDTTFTAPNNQVATFNPVQHPTTFRGSVSNGLARSFNFHDRMGRAEYWYWQLFLLIMATATTVAFASPFAGGLLYLCANWSATVRRLHDAGNPGVLALPMMFPGVGVFFWLVMMTAPGTPGANKYGLPTVPMTPNEYQARQYPLVMAPTPSKYALTPVPVPNASDKWDARYKKAQRPAPDTYRGRHFTEAEQEKLNAGQPVRTIIFDDDMEPHKTELSWDGVKMVEAWLCPRCDSKRLKKSPDGTKYGCADCKHIIEL